MRCKFSSCLILTLIFLTAPGAGYTQNNTALPKLTVIRNVTIIPMTSPNKVLYHATVMIKDSRIESINGVLPQQAEIIDGTGKWLIPGLVDMHVHIPSDFYIQPKLPTEAPDILFDVQSPLIGLL